MVGVSAQAHWDSVYHGRAPEELGWYEPEPSTLDLVVRNSCPAEGIIDIGAGESGLASGLLELGYHDVTLLDLSETALERARSRLGSAAQRVTMIRADVTDWQPTRTWNLWHDRAVFHFLTSDASREAYKSAALQALASLGRLIIATFSPEGPQQCAGLPVEGYDAETLVAIFAPELEPIEVVQLKPRHESLGDRRPYLAAVLRRSG
jgi:SAM-dependent methyltransferase